MSKKHKIITFLLFVFAILQYETAKCQNLEIYNNKVPNKIGSQFYDYQNYHNIAYFHGGLDLVAPSGTEVFSPIKGTVKVIDYKINAVLDPPSFSYERKPFKRGTVSVTRYLEVAITDKSTNLIWMFRHIDPLSIPPEIFTADENQTLIEPGTCIGKVAAWIQPVRPEKNNYDHIHLEIHDFEGNYINPANFIKIDKDYYPPVCKELYIVKAGTQEAFAYSKSNERIISDKVKFVISTNDRMNSSRYLHALYSLRWSLSKYSSEGKDIESIPEKEVFKFDYLPFSGDRTQLSKVIYYDSLKISAFSRVRANGSDGPRSFLINLNSGTTQDGYSDDNHLDTTKLENGNYKLKIILEDLARNKREKTYLLKIKN